MADPFSDVGFSMTDENYESEMKKIIEENKENTKSVNFDGGFYKAVSIGDFIELWIPEENGEPDIDSADLHYKTKTFLEVEDLAWLKDEDCAEEHLCSVFLPDYYPLNISVPAAKTVPPFVEGKRYRCQVAAFADRVYVYKNAEDFHKNKDFEHLNERSFIPIGTFPASEEYKELSSAVNLTGIVKAAQKRINDFTKNEYYVITAETFGGIYELLVDPELIPGGAAEGNIITGGFWMTGKIMPLETATRG